MNRNRNHFFDTHVHTYLHAQKKSTHKKMAQWIRKTTRETKKKSTETHTHNRWINRKGQVCGAEHIHTYTPQTVRMWSTDNWNSWFLLLFVISRYIVCTLFGKFCCSSACYYYVWLIFSFYFYRFDSSIFIVVMSAIVLCCAVLCAPIFDGIAFSGFCVCEIAGRLWHAHQFTIITISNRPCVLGWFNE